MKRLLSIAAEHGVNIKIATLASGVRGFYCKDDNTIYLSRRLTLIEQRCTLAHELGHAYFGHDCSTDWNENQANDFAARILILPREYAAAEYCSTDPEYLADELAVTVEMVSYYQQYALQRIGSRTYVRESHLERTAPRRVA